MKSGGINNHISLAKLVSLYSIFMPLMVTVYSLLVYYSAIDIHHLTPSHNSILIISIVWLAVGLIHFVICKSTQNDVIQLVALIIQNFLLGSFVVLVTGFGSIIAVLWLVLLLIAYSQYKVPGLVINLVGLLLFMLIDISLWGSRDHGIIILDIVVVGFISLVSLAITFLYQQREINSSEFEKIKTQAILARDRVSTLINNMTDAVINTDNDGLIQIYNAATLDLLDTNNDLKGHLIQKVLPLSDTTGKSINILEELQSAKKVIKRDDLMFSFGEDDKMRLEITYAPIYSSYSHYKSNHCSDDGYIIIMRDVTKAKSLEEERDELISVVSHELRTPITIAEGTLSNFQVMLEHKDVTKDMLRDNINTAHEQIVFLAGMVNDLSTLSRAERGVMAESEVIDVRELAHKLHDKYLDDASKKNLKLDLDLSARLGQVKTSRLYLEEMLQNFIINSIKYTKKGGITISFKQRNGQITFAIKDTGIGISKSDKNKIFDKFYRSEDYRTRETSGTGLGLYISKKLASKIKTKIEVRSRLNFGSTFSFDLPIVQDSKSTKSR